MDRLSPSTDSRWRLAVPALLCCGFVWLTLRLAWTPAGEPRFAPPTAAAIESAQAPSAAAARVIPAEDSRLRTPDPATAALSDAERTRRLLGVWTTQHHGRQRIVNRDDGTASLKIEFDWLASLLYGDRMNLELHWRIENGVLTNVIDNGTPAENVRRLTSDFGNSCRYRMLELSADRLLLQEIDDPAAFHEWKRVAAP